MCILHTKDQRFAQTSKPGLSERRGIVHNINIEKDIWKRIPQARRYDKPTLSRGILQPRFRRVHNELFAFIQ